MCPYCFYHYTTLKCFCTGLSICFAEINSYYSLRASNALYKILYVDNNRKYYFRRIKAIILQYISQICTSV